MSTDRTDTEGRFPVVIQRTRLIKTNDSGDQQLVDYEGLAGEKPTEVLRAMPHGLASHSPPESEAVVLSGGGSRDLPMVVGSESPQHRPRNLPEGATMLYDTAGSKVYLDADGTINVETNKAVNLKSPTITIEASTQLTFKSPSIDFQEG